jgi:hypothetical protein
VFEVLYEKSKAYINLFFILAADFFSFFPPTTSAIRTQIPYWSSIFHFNTFLDFSSGIDWSLASIARHNPKNVKITTDSNIMRLEPWKLELTLRIKG